MFDITASKSQRICLVAEKIATLLSKMPADDGWRDKSATFHIWRMNVRYSVQIEQLEGGGTWITVKSPSNAKLLNMQCTHLVHALEALYTCLNGGSGVPHNGQEEETAAIERALSDIWN